MGGLFSTAGPPLVYLLYRQPMAQQMVHQCLFLLFVIVQTVRLTFMLVTGSFTWGSLLYIVLSLPVVWLVDRTHERFPIRLSVIATTRLAAALLMLAGTGLFYSNYQSHS